MANDSRSVAAYVDPQAPQLNLASDPSLRDDAAPHRLLRAVVVILGIGLSAALALVIHNMMQREVAARDEVARQSLVAGAHG